MTPAKRTGITAEIWGPRAWGFLHAISFSYPKSSPSLVEREAAYRFLVSMGELLPCEKCREHYKAHINDPKGGITDSSSKHLAGADSLSRWTVELHNGVNARLGKPRMEYKEVLPLYSGDYTCPPEPVDRRRRGLLADLCDEEGGGILPSPERTLERGLPRPLEECFARFPGGNTGVATALVITTLLLIVIGVALSSRSKRHLLRKLEGEIATHLPPLAR